MSEAPNACDIAIVGAGILGLAVARELARRRPQANLCVLEREAAVATHQTGHNSGVIHAGIYYAPGSLKARLCVEGARDLYEYCDRNGVGYERSGKLIVAVDERELAGLDELERRGRANGVPGLRRLAAGEIEEIEPHCRGVGALHSPATGVVDFAAVAHAMAAELAENGTPVVTDCGIDGIEQADGRIVLAHPTGRIAARFAVFCAGGASDRLAVLAGAPADPRIVPFRGAYLRLRPERRELVRSLIYPVPDPSLPFLGVHLSRHLDDEVSVGPTALLGTHGLGRTLAWPGTWRMFRRWWRTGLTEVTHALNRGALARAAARYVPALERGDLRPWYAGVRAQAIGRDGRLLDDFAFSATERALHVRNAPSPAATAALAIARQVADQVEESAL